MTIVTNNFTVMALGFSEVERKIMVGVFRMAERRNPGYMLVDGSARISPDFFLVDADDLQAMRQLASLNPNKSVNTVFVGQGHAISRPFQWVRLLQGLDEAIPKTTLLTVSAQTANSVLVVDDSHPVRVFMKSKLEPLGLSVDYADSGEFALMMTERKIYNVIFLDVVMGGMDGYQVCKQIKSKKEHRDTTRVVMLTSKSSPFDKVRGAMAGCDAYLTKPVDTGKFGAIVSKFLSVPESGQPSSPEGHLNASWQLA